MGTGNLKNYLFTLLEGKLKRMEVARGKKNTDTVITENNKSIFSLSKNFPTESEKNNLLISGTRSLKPKRAITTNAAVPRKLKVSINLTKNWATKRMAKIPIKTPIIISTILLVKATAAKTLSSEKARSITSTIITVVQKGDKDFDKKFFME